MKIGIFGALGRMGRSISEVTDGIADIEAVEWIERKDIPPSGPDITYLPTGKADVYLEFTVSGNSGKNALLAASVARPIVIGTTGLTEDDEKGILEASRSVAVVRDSNMTLGITVLKELATMAGVLTGTGFDVEIVETHHKHKADAPSGTALSLLECFGKRQVVWGRYGKARRNEGEIGVHAVRGGGIFGEHRIILASEDEVIELRHSLLSRAALAKGALLAARFALNASPGIYSMKDVWNELKSRR